MRSVTSLADAYQSSPSQHALHSSQRHEPSWWRKRLVKLSSWVGSWLPASIGASVRATSFGCISSETGCASSSSRVQPSTCSHAGFSSVKWPSAEIVASRSLVISNSRAICAPSPVAASPAFGRSAVAWLASRRGVAGRRARRSGRCGCLSFRSPSALPTQSAEPPRCSGARAGTGRIGHVAGRSCGVRLASALPGCARATRALRGPC